MKIANIDREILHNIWTTWRISMKPSGKMYLLIILKVTKNQGFIVCLEDTIFKKPQGGWQFNPPHPLWLTWQQITGNCLLLKDKEKFSLFFSLLCFIFIIIFKLITIKLSLTNLGWSKAFLGQLVNLLFYIFSTQFQPLPWIKINTSNVSSKTKTHDISPVIYQ